MTIDLRALMELKEIRKAFGERVKALRKQRKWTQKELAGRIGVRFEQLNKYEAGLHAPPVDKLVTLADALDTTVDFLLSGDTTQARPLHNTRLLERFQALQAFNSNDLDVVVQLIDAMIAKRRMEAVLRPAHGHEERRATKAAA